MSLMPRQMVAEAVGTFFLVFPGAGAPMLNSVAGLGHPVSLLGIALANGLGLAVGVSATMAVSGGALNPAVTIGLWSLGKLRPVQALLYIVAELVGAVVAALLLGALIPHVSVAQGAPAPLAGLGASRAAAIEAVLTFLLMTAVLTTAVDRDAPKVAGFAIGTVVVFDVLAAGPLTGAAMNPARAFGPELVGHLWKAAWAYWVGPIGGALFASLIYRYFLQSEAPASQPSTAMGTPGRRRKGARR